MTPVRTVFFGSGGFGTATLRRLRDHPEVALVGVVTAPPKAAGRAGRLTATPIDAVAQELGIPTILRPSRLRAPEAVASVLALEPELAVLADYGQLVPRAILDLRFGAVNLHPSLLPRHRGATPIPATILAGDRVTGVTLFRMDDGLDTGPIVAQSPLELDGTETAPALEERLMILAEGLIDRRLGPWIRGEIEARPQPEAGATLTRPLRRADGRLDPREPAVQLERRVRAYAPWPGTFLETDAGRISVHQAAVMPTQPADVAGALVEDGDGVALVTADGRLVLRRVQPAGGTVMDAATFRRGRPGIVGSRVITA